jgi:hypothetical protein
MGGDSYVNIGLALSNFAITPVEAAGNASAYRIDPASFTIIANNAVHSFDAKGVRGARTRRSPALSTAARWRA